MARFRGSKNRLARRFGANIFGKKKSPVAKRSYGPGQHGNKRNKKRSEFGQQLHEKQKLACAYGVVPLKVLSHYYKEALGKKGNTTDHFIQILESRLDVVVYRMKFAPTIFAAQQLVSHKHVTVNGSCVNIRSYRVKPGDKISIKEISRTLPLIQDALNAARDLPTYYAYDSATFVGQMLNIPAADQVVFNLAINVPVVCEYLAYTT